MLGNEYEWNAAILLSCRFIVGYFFFLIFALVQEKECNSTIIGKVD
jgi:hypothetical protein